MSTVTKRSPTKKTAKKASPSKKASPKRTPTKKVAAKKSPKTSPKRSPKAEPKIMKMVKQPHVVGKHLPQYVRAYPVNAKWAILSESSSYTGVKLFHIEKGFTARGKYAKNFSKEQLRAILKEFGGEDVGPARKERIIYEITVIAHDRQKKMTC